MITYFIFQCFEQEENHPVVCVDWADAIAYTDWLAEKTGFSYRLPTEAEWEYAARAGTTSYFAFGNDADELCRYANIADKTAKKNKPTLGTVGCDDGYAKTAPVASYKPNRFGLFDVHGNVWEWVVDCYHSNYIGAPKDGSAWNDDCTGNPTEIYRVLRGGGWEAWDHMMASANRLQFKEHLPKDDFGFRVVRDPD